MMIRNYSLNYIKKILIIIFLILSILKLLEVDINVFAASSWTYDKTSWAIYEGSSVDPSGSCNINFEKSNFVFTEWTDLDTTQGSSSSTVLEKTIGQIAFRVYGNSSSVFTAGNSYTVRFTIDFNSALAAQTFINNYTVITVHGNTSASMTGASSDYIDSYSYRISQGSVDYRVLGYVTFSPTTDLKYFRVNFIEKNISSGKTTTNCNLVTGPVIYQYLQVTYEEGTNAVIENQTNTIINQTEMINNTINQRMEELINVYNSAAEETNAIMKDDSIDTSTSDSFFNDFKVESHGLSSMITIPLDYINSWTNACEPIVMPVLDQEWIIPCLSDTYKSKLGNDLFEFIRIIVSAPIAYAIIIYYVKSTNNAQNPDDNRLEVTDL